MRSTFSNLLYKYIKNDNNIIVLTGDLGYKMWDKIQQEYANNFYNIGSSEFLMLGIAAGLAIESKIPIAYSISPFLIFRPFEIIRTYINYENIPIKMASSGRDKDYLHDGISHWAHDIKPHLDLFPNIVQFWPETKEDISNIMEEFLYNGKPSFISLKR